MQRHNKISRGHSAKGIGHRFKVGVKKILKVVIILSLIVCAVSYGRREGDQKLSQKDSELAQQILRDEKLDIVYNKAKNLIESGFNAGAGYNEVWIRDYNTFINLSCDIFPRDVVKNNLLMFFRFQGVDGNIVDGYVPYEKKPVSGYDYIFSALAPGYAAHKNTVETDQESSLVQAVWKYVQRTGDVKFLQEQIDGQSVVGRLEQALKFLINERMDSTYGLIWGATTADWGDVQPEHPWGVFLTEDSHLAIDIYDNAMFLIAVQNYYQLLGDKNPRCNYWKDIAEKVKKNIRIHLWDAKRNKFIPHIYLNGSPFPKDFNEDDIFYHGGTAVAIEAGILNKDEIGSVLKIMRNNVKLSGAMSIGLTMYPPYPEGFFKNKGMYPYGYQNGGDWTWFGGRMIQQLVRHGYILEAYEELSPMIERVIDNNGFFEWYTVDGKPTGSGEFRGSAGVLATSIELLWEWAKS